MRMRSPPLAPGFDFETYIVLDDLGKLGRAYREVDEEYADRATVIRNITDGNIQSRFAWSLSTPPKVGHATLPRTLPARFWTLHTARLNHCPSQRRLLWNGLPAMRCPQTSWIETNYVAPAMS